MNYMYLITMVLAHNYYSKEWMAILKLLMKHLIFIICQLILVNHILQLIEEVDAKHVENIEEGKEDIKNHVDINLTIGFYLLIGVLNEKGVN